MKAAAELLITATPELLLLRKIQLWLWIYEGDELDLGEMAGLDFGGER
jgi:hypothetical protein